VLEIEAIERMLEEPSPKILLRMDDPLEISTRQFPSGREAKSNVVLREPS
jgi:hypothetical protein